MALARQLAAQANYLQSDDVSNVGTGGLEKSALLAIQSARRVPLFENDLALRQALAWLPIPVATFPSSDTGAAVADKDDGNERVRKIFQPLLSYGLDEPTHKEGKTDLYVEDSSSGPYVEVSPDGRYDLRVVKRTFSHLIVGAVFEAATGKKLWQLTEANEIRAVAFSPDNHYVAVGTYVNLGDRQMNPHAPDNTVRVFEIDTGKELSRLNVGDFDVEDGAFSPDGRYYVAVAKDKTAGVFKADTGESLWHRRLTEVGSIDLVTFSPDGHYVTIESHYDRSKKEVFVAIGLNRVPYLVGKSPFAGLRPTTSIRNRNIRL